MLRRSLAPKTVRNVTNFLNAAFALALQSAGATTTRSWLPRGLPEIGVQLWTPPRLGAMSNLRAQLLASQALRSDRGDRI
jgi:hypothetical protein